MTAEDGPAIQSFFYAVILGFPNTSDLQHRECRFPWHSILFDTLSLVFRLKENSESLEDHQDGFDLLLNKVGKRHGQLDIHAFP